MEGSKKMMKRPIKEVYGSDASDGFNKGKAETVERYRALLRLSNDTGYLKLNGIKQQSKFHCFPNRVA
ncbi:hypothetical protein Bca4012_094989 [Brassica carinata]